MNTDTEEYPRATKSGVIQQSRLALSRSILAFGRSRNIVVQAISLVSMAAMTATPIAAEETYSEKGFNLYTQGQFEQAASLFTKWLRTHSDDPGAYNNRGNAYKKLGHFDKAIADFDRVIALQPNYAVAYFNRGNSYSVLRQFDKALADYDKAIALKPDFTEAYHNRGLYYYNRGQFNKALVDLDRAIELDTHNPNVYLNRGNCYRATKQIDKAIADYNKAIALSPDDWKAYVQRGYSYQCLLQHEKAIADYNRVLGLKPEYTEAYTYRGSSYLALGQLDKALADFDKAIAIQPENSEAYLSRGSSHLALGEFDKALADYDKAIALKPDSQIAYIGRGEVLARQKKLTDSFQVFERALPQNATNSYFYSSRAVAQFISGDKSKGSADIEKALALAGEDAEAKQSANKIKNEFMEQSGTISATSASKDNKDRPIGDKWAVIVGVDNFADPTVPKLHYSKKDARDFYQYLTTKAGFKPDHVRLLLDEKATRERIWTEIGDVFLPHVVSPDDLVVLYFSTHGSPAEKDIRGSSYLIAYDTKKSRLYADGIEMPMLLASLQKRTGADRVLIVLDACHSGAADPGAKSADFQSSLDIDQIAVGRGNIIITSSQPDERSWESKHYANGIFTRRLIDSLSQNPNVIQGFDNLKDIVANEVRQEHGQRQTPRLKADGWEGRQLLLTAPATKSFPISDDVKKQLEPDSKTDVVSPTPLSK